MMRAMLNASRENVTIYARVEYPSSRVMRRALRNPANEFGNQETKRSDSSAVPGFMASESNPFWQNEFASGCMRRRSLLQHAGASGRWMNFKAMKPEIGDPLPTSWLCFARPRAHLLRGLRPCRTASRGLHSGFQIDAISARSLRFAGAPLDLRRE